MSYTVTFSPRTGKDLFDFLKMSELDNNSAKNWALESFVKINGEPITIHQIAKLRNAVYLEISEKIFSLNVDVEENNIGIVWDGKIIKRKNLSRDFITDIQARIQGKKRHSVDLIKLFIVESFEVSIIELDSLAYEVVAYMFKEVNTFLTNLTKPASKLTIESLFEDDSCELEPGRLGDLA